MASILGRLESALSHGIAALFILVAAHVAWGVLANYRSPLRKCPGPFVARWTDLWRFYHTLRGDIHLVNKRMHAKYGPVVRTGPNNLDLDLPELIKTIYTTDGRWCKTEFYPPASSVVDGKVVYNVFSVRDPVEHARQKKPIAKHYSLPSILQLEGHVDEAILLLGRQLEDRFMRTKDGSFGESFDLGEWISMYAWDVIGQITFSKHFGYLENGRDFDGHIRLSGFGSDYMAAVGQLPYLDRWIDKNPFFPIGGATRLLLPTLRRFHDRMRSLDNHKSTTTTTDDFLDRFVQAKAEHPEVVDDRQIVSYLTINMVAGADTTAITIKAVLYYILRTPRTQDEFARRLRVMNAADLAFGAGSRVCLGRHLGLVEVYKVVAALFARYEMDMVHPEKEWWTRNGFFLRQKGLQVRMKRRDRAVA
ncbi:pisatin demethylase [Magnaporthiopsis poae ATCC 64411]|uniref:Pisatin demethylase n=1 Tax=Magnaporthiopsis poae (strain ATCC 64411 / 73-15) TaxID=644358 RepID=A0A0C4DSS1_MAGP6|nr:pisatin demethylase [Magnaporthiopsis poae ATCC 64411]